MQIAKTLKQAFDFGRPELAADLIRQKLTIALFQLQQGEDAFQVIKDFQNDIGMNEFPVYPTKKAA